MFKDQVDKVLASYAEIAGKQPDAIAELHSVYKTIFGEGVKKSCGDCNVKAFFAIQKRVFLQSQNENFNFETMKEFKDRNFVIAPGKALTVEFGGETLTNDNLTDEAAFELLNKHPNLVKHFVKYPKDEAGKLDLSQVDLSLLSEDEQNRIKKPKPQPQMKLAKAAAANTSDAKQLAIDAKVAAGPAGKALSLPNEGETPDDAAIRLGVSLRTVQRSIKKAADIAAAIPGAEDELTEDDELENKEIANGTDNIININPEGQATIPGAEVNNGIIPGPVEGHAAAPVNIEGAENTAAPKSEEPATPAPALETSKVEGENTAV